MNHRLDADRWRKLCARVGCPSAASRFDDICRAYGERHRHYHTAQHIQECLRVFDACERSAEHADHVEMAIWLHDLVYKTRRHDNEAQSADVARRWLSEAGAECLVIDRIAALIAATKHDTEPEDADQRLLLDVDLNVLGAQPPRYEEYEAQVRREYRWVPRPLFNRRRAELLETFLSREPLYNTPWFRERFEAQAQANLERAVANLRG